jgi:aspartate racemase
MPKTVGIIGGMGPAATVDLMARIIRLSPAKSDQDGIRMLVDNNPHVPDRNKAIANAGPSPAPELAAMARGLEAQGADFLVMACNTAHAFQAAIASAVNIPFVGMIQETVAAAKALPSAPRQVALLAAAGCLDAGLYQQAFAAEGIGTLVPEGSIRENFMRLLYGIKGGEMGSSVRREMKALADQLGGEAVIAGCTEVPLVMNQDDIALPFIDSTERLAQAVVDIAYGTRELP